MKRVVLASNNAGKLAELGDLLSGLAWQLETQGSLGVSEADEPWPTFVENALTKARHASRATGLPALADDSGLCVERLGGAPGVRSARYAGEPKDDARNNAHLIAELDAAGIAEDDWEAMFVSVIVYVEHADDPLPVIAEGRWTGRVVREARGPNGFGYDGHFFVPALHRTAAELDPGIKNRRSHRALALRALLERLAPA
ncbi:RdgB/HAM1 family non-canonical purine NTP pyrophosphatase [soil metagenome]